MLSPCGRWAGELTPLGLAPFDMVARAHPGLLANRDAQTPAEADMQRHFQVSPPSVHQMVLTLERAGLIRRTPGVARSIELLVEPKDLPVLR